jgi:prepilin-type processing-associated H-X9-DG protein
MDRSFPIGSATMGFLDGHATALRRRACRRADIEIVWTAYRAFGAASVGPASPLCPDPDHSREDVCLASNRAG